MSEETTQESVQETPRKRRGISLFKIVIILIIVGVVAVSGYVLLGKGGALSPAVAIVNGEKISQTRFNDYESQVAAVFTSQGQDITGEEVQASLRQRVIDDLVAETLITQKAKEAGITVNATAVTTQFDQAKGQFADDAAFQAELTKQGFTESSFKEMLERQDVFQQYIDAKIDLSAATVTEEEINTFYEQASESSENIPALEEVRTQIEAEILRQKQQAIVTEHVQALRAASTVEVI